jgi:hypothetical protein
MTFSPNPDLLVTSDALEENLFDKATGLPLSGGIVTFYVDGTNTLKNIYQQTGALGGPYTYTALPNPMTLNADGSTSDSSGNNVKIYYYPYAEGVLPLTPQYYYVTVYNSAGTFQFSRSNFPFGAVPIQPTPGTTTSATNQIVNGRFWRNNTPTSGDVSTPANTISINGVTNYYTTLAPSQHDSFSMPDIIFIKNGTAAPSSDTIIFGRFPQNAGQTLTGDITPEYYLDFHCTANGSDTYKYIQIPISLHLSTLGGALNCTVSFQGLAVSGTSPTVGIQIFPFAGTGVTSPAPVLWQTFTLTSSWQKYSATLTMPPSITEGLLGAGGDDAFYLQLVLPAGAGGNAICEIQLAVPSYYTTNVIPTNDFETYDAIDAIVNSPRTGDFRQSLNTFSPFGWVAANNGTIGAAGSGATNWGARDAWPLYNLLWNSVNDVFVPLNGSPGNRGGSAYSDFSANKTMMLTSALGKVLMGNPIALNATYNHATTPSWNQTNYPTSPSAVAGLFTLTGGANNTILYPGAPVILGGVLPVAGAFTAGVVYYAIPDPTQSLMTGTTFQLATTYARAIGLIAIAAVGTNDGGAITVAFALGGNFGEGSHIPNIAELASHNHPGSTGSQSAGGGVGTACIQGTPGSANTQVITVASQGNTQLFNVVQPSLYTNVFIKL